MRERLPRYFLLSFVSFCFFTVMFHAFAYAQALTVQQVAQRQNAAKQQQLLPPTPTIYQYNQPTQAQITLAQQTTPTPTPTPHKNNHLATPITPTQAPTPTTEPVEQTRTTRVTTKITPATPTATPIPTATDTPTPTPTVTPLPTQIPQPSSPTLETMFSQASSTYNVSEDELKKIAKCESGFNTNATADGGLYTGMFQFSASTWEAERKAMGLDPNPDLRTNPQEAVKTTAFMLSHGQQDAWPNCH